MKSPRNSRERRPRFDRSLAVASFAIAVGVVMIGFAVARSVTGSEATKLPSAIERVTPVPDAVQVLAQSQVIVDLDEGYEGRLSIDGIEFETLRMEQLTDDNVEPGAQVEIPAGVVFEPGNDTLTFTPGEEIDIARFEDGTHRVTVIYWHVDDGPQSARSYSWTFNVV